MVPISSRVVSTPVAICRNLKHYADKMENTVNQKLIIITQEDTEWYSDPLAKNPHSSPLILNAHTVIPD